MAGTVRIYTEQRSEEEKATQALAKRRVSSKRRSETKVDSGQISGTPGHGYGVKRKRLNDAQHGMGGAAVRLHQLEAEEAVTVKVMPWIGSCFAL